MRILIVASFVPYPPDSGARIRTWEVARHFQREHEVIFAFHVRSQDDLARVEAIRRSGFQVITGWIDTGFRAVWNTVKETFVGAPPLFSLRRSRELEVKLNQISVEKPFDVIQLEHFELARYGELIRGPRETIRSMVLHDVLSVSYGRMAKIGRTWFWQIWHGYNAHRLRVYEKKLLKNYDVCITVSENDRQKISHAASADKIHVLPNGVDAMAKRFLPEPPPYPPLLLFVGLFLYPPNTDAACWLVEHIFPQIRKQVPDCRLTLVGADAPKELKDLVSRQPGVVLTGWVEDVTPYYEMSHLAVVPLRAGGGTRLKILEAMAYGRAVVSTSIGAEGLTIQDNEQLAIADTAQDFAQAVILLLNNTKIRSRLRQNARSTVEQQYSWNSCSRSQLVLYQWLRQSR